MGGQLAEEGRLLVSNAAQELSQSFQSSLQTLKDQMGNKLAVETQSRFEKLTKDISECLAQQENLLAKKIYLLSGQLEQELDSKLSKIKQEFCATSSSELKKISNDLDLVKHKLEKVESSVPLVHSALQPSDIEGLLARVGSDKLPAEIAKLSTGLLDCQNSNRTSKADADKKFQEILASL